MLSRCLLNQPMSYEKGNSIGSSYQLLLISELQDRSHCCYSLGPRNAWGIFYNTFYQVPFCSCPLAKPKCVFTIFSRLGNHSSVSS